VEAHTVVRHRGSHIFQTIGSQLAVGLALRARRALLQKYILVLISARGWVNSVAVVRLEGLGKLNKFRLIAQCPREH
jgi:hypothetical protein